MAIFSYDFAGYLFSAPWVLLAGAIVTITVIHWAGTSFYRVYYHPLANIPGPFLAKVTHIYSFYYNFGCGGRFYLKIDELHKKYGKERILYQI